MAFTSYMKLLAVGFAFSMVVIVHQAQATSAPSVCQSITLTGRTVAALNGLIEVCVQIKGTNPVVLAPLVDPIISLSQQLLSTGACLSVLGILQTLVTLLTGLVTTLLLLTLSSLGVINATLLTTFTGLVPELAGCVLVEASFVVKGALCMISGLVCLIAQILV